MFPFVCLFGPAWQDCWRSSGAWVGVRSCFSGVAGWCVPVWSWYPGRLGTLIQRGWPLPFLPLRWDARPRLTFRDMFCCISRVITVRDGLLWPSRDCGGGLASNCQALLEPGVQGLCYVAGSRAGGPTLSAAWAHTTFNRTNPAARFVSCSERRIGQSLCGASCCIMHDLQMAAGR